MLQESNEMKRELYKMIALQNIILYYLIQYNNFHSALVLG